LPSTPRPSTSPPLPRPATALSARIEVVATAAKMPNHPARKVFVGLPRFRMDNDLFMKIFFGFRDDYFMS
jgi:hypothetical protein